MQIGTTLSLVGAGVAIPLFTWQRKWILLLAWLFSLASTVFGKVFPSVLPEYLVTSFFFGFFALVLIHYWWYFFIKESASSRST